MKKLSRPASYSRLGALGLGVAAVAAGVAAWAADDSQETVVVTSNEAQFKVPEGQVERPGMPDMTLKLPDYQLNTVDLNFPSGLRMLFQADHSAPVVSVYMVVDRGSTADPIGKEGIAHFVEHLWFRSVHTAPDGTKLPKTWDLLKDLGADLNAFTADDITEFMTVAPSSGLPGLLRLESLRLTEPIAGVEESVVDTEREVIRNELRMRYENTSAIAFPYLFDKLYPKGHPYQRLGIGTHDSLNNCHLADIKKFTDDNYRPENATIVVVGDFDLNDVGSLVFDNVNPALLHPRMTEKDLAKAPRPGVEKPDRNDPDDWVTVALDPDDHSKALSAQGTPPKRVSGPAAEPPPVADQTMAHAKAAIDNPIVFVAWTVPGSYHGEDDALQIMASVAGSYVTDYFRQNDKHVDANQTGCFLWDGKVDGKVLCEITTDGSEPPEKIAEKAVDQIAFMWDADYNYNPALNVKFIDMALQREKMSHLADILRSLDLHAEVGGGRTSDIANHAHFTGSATYHSDAMKETMTVTGQEIADLAYKYLRRDRYAQLYVEPLPKDEVVVGAAQSTSWNGAQGGDDVLRSAYPPDKIDVGVIRANAINPDTTKLIDTKLPNGLRVIVMHHGETPMVEAGLYLNGGTTAQPLGIDDFAEQFNTTTWNDLNRKSDPLRIAGKWEFENGPDYTWRGLQAASGNLDGALWLLREAVEGMHPYMDGKTDFANKQEGWLETDWKNRDGYYHPGFVTQMRQQQINPGHPLSWQADWTTYEQWKQWGASDVQKYAAQKYQPANATLVIVGNVNAKQAEKLAEYYFQGWKPKSGATAGAMPGLPGPNPATAAPRVVVFDDPQKTQTDVTYMCPIVPATPQNDAARKVLGDYLDEQAWIALRENGGVTYGANSTAAGYPGGTDFLWMGSLVQNNGTALAVQTFSKIADRATAGDFKFEGVQSHKLDVAKRYVITEQATPDMRRRLLSNLRWGTDWSVMTGYADRLAAVDAKQLQGMMGDCTKHAITTVEGPLDQIKPVLDAAGVKYEVYDWKQAGKDLLAKYDPKAFKAAQKAEAKQKAEDEKKKKDAPTSSTGTPAPAPTTPAPAPTPAPEPTPAPAPAPAPSTPNKVTGSTW